MARISTGKTPPAKGKSAAAPLKTGTKPKTTAAPAKKKATAVPQVKAAASKKVQASAKPVSGGLGSSQIVATRSATGKRPAAAQQIDAPKRSADQRQSAAREGSAAKSTLARKAVAKSPIPVAKQTTAKVTPLPRAPQASKAPQPARAAAKTVSVKVAAPRRPATRTQVLTPATRRVRPVTPPRKAAPPQKAAAAVPQTFTVSHLSQTDFKPDGLRTYAHYRDLGIAAATGGLCQAHVIRFIPPCTDEVRKRHQHKADLQLIYVLQGWMKNEFEGHGQQMMSAGSCWLQPSGIKHTVLDYSADCEVLEIIMPADFETQELP